ncbi:MAG: sugar ABC transporter ATP-binding protein, partial [Raoultibacter sp.]
QLYLSLRIALLMAAENVGRATPILADDILVNFDADRRVGAARALRELSKQRQVILFTCHEEIVNLMQDVDSQLNCVQL